MTTLMQPRHLDPSLKSAEPVVRVTDLVRRHGSRRNPINALRGVDLSVDRGEFVAIMGATGSGKTTLLHCLGGLDRPTSGHLHVDGRDLLRMREGGRTRWRRQHVGIVFQDLNLLPGLSVLHNVLLPHRLGARTDGRRRAVELLEAVGLSDAQRRPVGELSGGQQQRAAIARALLTRPTLLLADEPTGALDPTTADGVLGLLQHQTQAHGTTTVMVTHDPRVAARADRVVVLRDGALAGQLIPADIDDLADAVAVLAGSADRGR